ncbi:MAG: hypothetical protein HQM00_16505, partial [Magnetococcales bacterium]|nr:hypothetical protein [Magnetococcales bacterium]
MKAAAPQTRSLIPAPVHRFLSRRFGSTTNTWTIRRLLTVWAAMGVIATIALAGAAAFANIRLTTLQNRVMEQILPVETSGRRLSSLLLEYVNRQNVMVQALSPEALDALPARAELDARFTAEINTLGAISRDLPGLEQALEGLQKAYAQFLEQDNRLLDLTKRDLELAQRMKARTATLDQTVERMTTHA